MGVGIALTMNGLWVGRMFIIPATIRAKQSKMTLLYYLDFVS